MIREDCRGASLEESWLRNRTQLPDESRGLCRSRGLSPYSDPEPCLGSVLALGVGLAPQSRASPSYETELRYRAVSSASGIRCGSSLCAGFFADMN